MFNLKDFNKTAQIAPYEKYHRKENLGPKADDHQSIWEKNLPHRGNAPEKISEDQLESQNNIDDTQIIEKVLNEAQSYVQHRSDATWLSVPPLNVLVEKMRQKRLEDYKPEKKSHWSQSLKDKAQLGTLPKWPKGAKQHDKLVLNNDPDRFKGVNHLPTSADQSENDASHGNSGSVDILVGDITKAEVHQMADMIKQGSGMDHDKAIYTINKTADKEGRELNPIEQKSVSDIKIARTNYLLGRIREKNHK